MKTICEVLLLTATQNLPQHGHRESEESTNRGNFLEILKLVASHDEIVQKRLTEGPQNAKYKHHSIQDALLNVMADMILHQITDEVIMSQYFGLLCDEKKDLSKG